MVNDDTKIKRPPSSGIQRDTRTRRPPPFPLKRGDEVDEFVRKMLLVIKQIEKNYIKPREVKQLSLFDLLQKNDQPEETKLSFGQIADLLNEQGHTTIYGKSWTRMAVKRLIEHRGGDRNENLGHLRNKQEAANLQRMKQSDEFALKMRDEVLPKIDTSQKHHIIANELNKRGIKTRSGGEWVNSSVKRLLERIQELS
ncbi:MAG: recombinase family protein [Proteobacteria bacterium]|nr:recombinase family protein [Pseudomonadota bacterium]